VINFPFYKPSTCRLNINST